MLRQISGWIFAGALAVCSQGAVAQDQVITVPVDDDFETANLRWNNATAGGYDGLIALKAVNGQIALCGVGIVTNNQLNVSVRRMLLGGVLLLDDEPVIKNFTYFAKAKSVSGLRNSKANCKLSGVSARKPVDVYIKLGKGTFRN